MRNPNRIDPIIDALRSEWHKHPDYRFGQLFNNLLRDTAWFSKDTFNMEDEVLEKALKVTEQP